MAAKFRPPASTEAEFRRQLRKVARTVGGIVEPYLDGKGGIVDAAGLAEALERYATIIEPWASRVVIRMLQQIGTANLRSWSAQSADLGRALRTVYADQQIGAVWRMLHTRQVELIKSLPGEAGRRALTIAANAQLGGIRARTIADDIRDLDRTGAVTEARALMIARTEIAKANAAMTQARATFVGSTHYIWRTMNDPEVRSAHEELEGEVFEWATPPEVRGEGRHHPGEFPNCRCFAEPIITGAELDERKEAAYQEAARAGMDRASATPRTLERIRGFLELAG